MKLKKDPFRAFSLPDLTGMKPPEALTAVMTVAENFIQTDGDVSTWIEGGQHLIQGTELEQAIQFVSTRLGRVDKSEGTDEYYRWLRSYVHPASCFQREQIALAADQLALSPAQKLLLRLAPELGAAFDEWYLDWVTMTSIPLDATKDETEMTDEELTEIFATLGFSNKYAIIVDENGVPFIRQRFDLNALKRYQEVSLIEAFPIIYKILPILLRLARGMKSEEPKTALYFKALHDALACKDLDKAEEMWKAVDLAWIAIPRSTLLVPFHPMEFGYKHAWLVMPEFRIIIRTKVHADELRAARRDMLALAEEYSDTTYAKKARRTDMFIGVTVMYSGIGALEMRFTGQSVPNRPEVQRVGMRTFIDPTGVVRRIDNFLELAQRCLTPDAFRDFERYLTPRTLLRFICGHEAGHPVHITDALITEFGAHKHQIEEIKADFTSIISRLLGVSAEEYDLAVRHILAEMVGSVLRRLEKTDFGRQQSKPYANIAMAYATIMFEEGFLFVSDGRLQTRFDDDGIIRRVFERIEDILDIIMDAYPAIDWAPLQKVLDQHADRKGTVIVEACKVIDACHATAA